jgi:Glycosyl hydrolases family 43
VRPNPIIPGFNPDPSVVLVGGVYHLVTSSFEYLPGLPVYRSTDLTAWTHVGNVATRPDQVQLDHVPTPGGAWARSPSPSPAGSSACTPSRGTVSFADLRYRGADAAPQREEIPA